MSSLINKVKDVVNDAKTPREAGTTTTTTTKTTTHHTTPHNDTTGVHGTTGHNTTGTTGLTGNHNTHDTTGTSGLSGTHNTHSTTGTGLTGNHNTTGTYGSSGPASNTDGPHKSNLMNKADPRIDSDRDYSKNMGANPQGNAATGTHSTTAGHGTGVLGTTGATHNTHTTGTGLTGNHGTTGTHTTGTHAPSGTYGTSGPASNTDGPHNSNMMNKVDPRIDSDRDYSKNMGANPQGNAATGAHHGPTAGHGTSNTGAFGTTGTTHNTHTTPLTSGTTTGHTTGTHVPGSNTHTTGTHVPGSNTHTTGTHVPGTTGTTGTHGTNGHTVLGSSYATGPAANTAGPHKSDLLNKADPRVDSDLNGSKTVGGNKTFGQDNYAHKDPRDATQVPPSVMQKHIGGPTVAHDSHPEDHVRRNSVQHQTEHRGL